MPECDVFGEGSRQYYVCRGEAGLSRKKTDWYRVERWGFDPLYPETKEELAPIPESVPELVFHGKSVSENQTSHRLYGPGTELLEIYKSAGVPHCDACMELAQQMNDWGVDACRLKINDIVQDMLPRAKAWITQNKPWMAILIPDAIEEIGITIKLKWDISKAIDTAATLIASKREFRLKAKQTSSNHGKIGCNTCGKARSPTSKINRPRGSSRASFCPPIIGSPINRDRLQSHILYHVMPLAGDTEWVWRKHCNWLREVRSQFNGRLIIGIVTPGQSDAWSYCNPEVVREALSGLDAEFIEAPNDTGNHTHRKHARQGVGEGVLFPKMLKLLETSDPDHVAFYGHCKGVTRPQTPTDAAIHRWADAMFETLFRNHDAAVDALDTHGVCGPFRMRGGYRDGGPGIGSNWFYSGTFFGMRLVDVFSRKWEYVPGHYGCVEQWPRLNFDQKTQSACLFFDGVTNLYDEQYWKSVVTPAFEQWKNNHGTSRAT